MSPSLGPYRMPRDSPTRGRTTRQKNILRSERFATKHTLSTTTFILRQERGAAREYDPLEARETFPPFRPARSLVEEPETKRRNYRLLHVKIRKLGWRRAPIDSEISGLLMGRESGEVFVRMRWSVPFRPNEFSRATILVRSHPILTCFKASRPGGPFGHPPLGKVTVLSYRVSRVAIPV